MSDSTAYFEQVCASCGRCPQGLQGNIPRQWPTIKATVETKVYVNMGAVSDNDWGEHRGRAIERFKQGLISIGWTEDEITSYVTFAHGVRNATGKSTPVKAWRDCGAYVTADILSLRPALVISWDTDGWCSWGKKVDAPKVGRCVDVPQLRWPAEKDVMVDVDWNLKYMAVNHPDVVYDFPHMVDSDSWLVDLAKIKWILNGQYPVAPETQGEYRTITDPAEAVRIFQECAQSTVHACDIESGNAPHALDVYSDGFKILGVALCWEIGRAYFIPLFHKDCMLGENEAVWAAFVEWAGSASYRVMHNGTGFDSNAFYESVGVRVRTHFDTMLADGLLNENRNHTLKHLTCIAAPFHGNYEDMLDEYFVIREMGANGKPKKPKKIARDKRDYELHLPLEVLGLYGAIDADVTLRVQAWEVPLLQQIPSPGWGSQLDFFVGHVMQCGEAYSRISQAGMPMDMERVERFRFDVLKELDEARTALFAQPVCAQFAEIKAAQFTEEKRYYVENGFIFGAYHVAKDCMQPLYDTTKGEELELGAKQKLQDLKVITSRGTVVKSRTFGPADVTFNPGSSPDVGFMMSKVLKERSTTTSRKTGKASWADKELKKFVDKHPFVQALLNFKKLDKAASTYVHPICNGMFETVNAKGTKKVRRGWIKDDGLVHPQFLLAGNDRGHGTDGEKGGGAVTGRISSRDPNGTNFAKHSKYGKRLYGLFRSRFHNPAYPFAVSEEHAQKLWDMMSDEEKAQVRHFVLPGQPGGGAIIQADYSQLELRIFAIIVKVAWMIQKYQAGADLHWELAMRIFRIAVEEIVRDAGGDFLPKFSLMRSAAKSGWFGPIYGEGAVGMWEDLVSKGVPSNIQEGPITLGEVEQMLEETYALMPEFEMFKEDVRRQLVDTGCVFTVTGRRRFIPQANSSDKWTRSKAIRQGVNSLIQGPGADCNNYSVRQIQVNMAAAVGLDVDTFFDRQRVRSGIELAHRYGVPIGAVHDSNVLDVPSECVPEVAELVRNTMQNVPFEALSTGVAPIDLVVDVEAGPSWSPMELATI